MIAWQSPKLATATLAVIAVVTASFSLPFRAPQSPAQEVVQESEPILDFEDRWDPVNRLPPMVTKVKTISFLEPQEVSDLVISKTAITVDQDGIIKPRAAGLGPAWRGTARPGEAWLGKARQGKDLIDQASSGRSKPVCNAHGLRTVWTSRWSWRCSK